MNLEEAISKFGISAKSKLTNLGAEGEPEDQLRSPLEELIKDMTEISGLKRADVAAVGETHLADIKTRPDFSVTYRQVQCGFIEVKAPGKGADPRRFKDKHDREQWERLKCLPNLIYTDGNSFSLWHDGELARDILKLDGDVETSGKNLKAPLALEALFEDFLKWNPAPPRDARQLAHSSARLCHFLREEVMEVLSAGSSALDSLRTGWQKMLFPEATEAQFADGYAQAVTFGLLVARARKIDLSIGLPGVSKELGDQSSLIGSALGVLTEAVHKERALTTSIDTMTRVIGVVDWQRVTKGKTDAWLYFYEDFLSIYDNDLRRKTGSYYTPPEVVRAMVRMVDEALRSRNRFDLARGLADRNVAIADPAVGTGTFILGLLQRIAAEIEHKDGPGAVPAGLQASLQRIYGFELQLGPFAVAQLRIMAELAELSKPSPPPTSAALHLYVTDTLSNPHVEAEWIPHTYAPLAESRKAANRVKLEVPITVVIGNPPYKEKAMGKGGWIEAGGVNDPAPLDDWQPPADWGVGAHAKHLRNLYIYFWRWATWKVFDLADGSDTGLVCFITVAGFLNGPGFQKMRAYLREKANEIWVVDCSPEGHQPEVATRIFQGVQQPVCIVLAARYDDDSAPAVVRHRSLPLGDRRDKFAALASMALDDDDWEICPSDPRSPFLPASRGVWSEFPKLDELFVYNGSGVMPGRTWIIAPDPESLERRWQALQKAPAQEKESLFHPHLDGDRTLDKSFSSGLPHRPHRPMSVGKDDGPCLPPCPYAFRSFDRQWIIPDIRLINRPNPTLWETFSSRQVYFTSLEQFSPTSGPSLTVCGRIPDLHHYKGSFGGRAFPLYANRQATEPNLRRELADYLSRTYGEAVTPEEVFAYIAAIAANPAYTERFKEDLRQPGLRIPITADVGLFRRAVRLGRRVVWLHTYGERFVDPADDRPYGAPRVEPEGRPVIPLDGAIPADPERMPDTIGYNESLRRLLVGDGYVANVAPEVWAYEVSGKRVVHQWFSYRKRNRERPIIGDRRPPSKLGDVQPDHWLPEYTSDLIDLLNVLTLLVRLEPEQAKLLDDILAAPLIARSHLLEDGALADPSTPKPKLKRTHHQPSLLDDHD